MDYDKREYRPSFRAQVRMTTCIMCGEDVGARLRYSRACTCESCIYCSEICRDKDSAAHKQRCVNIRRLVKEVDAKIDKLFDGRNRGEVQDLFNPYPHYSAYEQHCTKMSWEDFWERTNKINRVKNAYLDTLERLIIELIREGWCRWDQGIKNELAFKIASEQSMDLLQRRKGHHPQLHNHIYLLTGRWQEMHNLCCHLARQGGDRMDPGQLSIMRMITWEPGFIKQHNYTKSYFQHGKATGKIFVKYEPEWGYTGWESLIFMYLSKWFRHMEKENLAVIDETFLNNPDCTDHIGEYLGMKKEWMHCPRIYFSDQAFEILRLFHIQDKYFEAGMFDWLHDEMKEFSEKCYPDAMRKLVVSALAAGGKWVDNFRMTQTLSPSMPSSRWEQVIKSYEDDHRLLYATSVRPNLPWIVKKVNAMAGFDVLGLNVDADLSVSRLFVEADEACYTSHQRLFSELYDDPFGDIAKEGWAEFNSISPIRNQSGQIKGGDSFFERSLAIMMCVMIELKLAQCHFHHRCRSEQAKELLDQIPEDSYALDPPNEANTWPPSEESPRTLGDFFEMHYELGDSESRIRFASEWIPTVIKTVDALFAAGLATSDNLSLLFGNDNFVSYRVWTLNREKSERAQMSISAFVTRSRLWKEGCTEYNAKLDLKIKYLNDPDRRQRFEEMAKLGSVGNAIQLLKPSVEQFVAKFGWDGLDLGSEDFFREYCGSKDSGDETSDEPSSKKAKLEFDNFDTASEACRHYFDASSLEAAVWDFVGVPRLLAVDADKEKMTKAGWKCCGVTATLGDKTVELGNRIVHVCSGWSTVWKECGVMGE